MSTFYRNNKNGNLYQVLFEATDSTNNRDGNKVIIYQKYGDDEHSNLYVRDKDEFEKKFHIVHKSVVP